MYYSFQELDKGKWSQSDTLCFDIDSASVILNTPVYCNIELVNNTDYLYQNIWLYIQDDFSGETSVNEKQYELCDEYGKWYGSGFGSLYQLGLSYKREIVFRERKNYRIRIIQGMRDEPLVGIEKVGIKLAISPN